MKTEEKTKLQVNVSRTTAEKIKEYAQTLGVTRSAFCALLINQGMLFYEANRNFIQSKSRERCD